jgi:glucan-binding YG repeat protein
MLLATYMALNTLGISILEVLTAGRVNSAWKAKIKAVHPDKNQGTAAATALAQKYNDARDTLLKHLQKPEETKAKKAMDDEYERAAVEKDMAAAAAIAKAKAEAKAAAKAKAAKAKAAEAKAAEAKAAEAKAAEAKAAEANAAEAKAAEAKAAEAKAAEAANETSDDGKKKRKRRSPDTRLHRKIGSYEEGISLLQAMRQYFLETYSYSVSPGSRVMVADIMVGFMKFRPSTTRVESNLFQRHSKRILMETVPGASYSKYKDKRCFVKLSMRIP